MLKRKEKSGNPLWTHDFTIITLGSVVSMLGNSFSGYAMSLLVLDYTGSTFLYAIYLACFTVPQLIMPIFSGAILDRFSRKKMIYTLDFCSAGLYLIMALIFYNDWFSFPLFAFACVVIGSINSVYYVAYDSFYPLLITEGNYSKAYSISSVLETLSSLMIPVATFAYNQVGMVPLLLINVVTFFTAAVMETRIKAEEKYIDTQKENADENLKPAKQMLLDIKEGFLYLSGEKGLLAIALYFGFCSLAGGASGVITLPFFVDNFENGEYTYLWVWGFAILGRAIGGLIHYKVKYPPKAKYAITIFVYMATNLIEGFYLYSTNIHLMQAMCFFNGILGVTSYTIRIAATQKYVPDEKKGRFNGAFMLITTAGSLIGELLAGSLTIGLDQRYVLTGFMMVALIAAVIIIGGGRRNVKQIYNVED